MSNLSNCFSVIFARTAIGQIGPGSVGFSIDEFENSGKTKLPSFPSFDGFGSTAGAVYGYNRTQLMVTAGYGRIGGSMLRGIWGKLFRRPEKRRERREDASHGSVEIDGRSYRVKNWSSTGFLASPCNCGRREGDSVDIVFSIQAGGNALRFTCKAIVVRSGNGELAGVFTMMERDIRMAVTNYFQ